MNQNMEQGQIQDLRQLTNKTCKDTFCIKSFKIFLNVLFKNKKWVSKHYFSIACIIYSSLYIISSTYASPYTVTIEKCKEFLFIFIFVVGTPWFSSPLNTPMQRKHLFAYIAFDFLHNEQNAYLNFWWCNLYLSPLNLECTIWTVIFPS